jgi:hypothetical protein
MIFGGLCIALLERGAAVSTLLLVQAFRRGMRERIFCEESPLRTLRDEPATSLRVLSPTQHQYWGERCIEATNAILNEIAVERGLCAEHLWKL